MERKSMNDPHKFGTEFGSDNAHEHSAAIASHHDSIKWFEAIHGEQLCIRVHGTQVNGRYAIMENIAAQGTATPMHFHAEDEIFHILEGTVTFSIDGDVFECFSEGRQSLLRWRSEVRHQVVFSHSLNARGRSIASGETEVISPAKH